MTRTVGDQARRSLRWFPGWMRADRGEEAVGLVLDQLPPGTARLPWRARADLVRAGLHARRRGLPPLSVWRTVSTINTDWNKWNGRGSSIPVAWRPWLIVKLQMRSFPWACALLVDPWQFAYLLFMAALYYRDFGARLLYLVPLSCAAIVVAHALWFVVRRRHWRSRLLTANGLGPDGRPLPPDQVVEGQVKHLVRNGWAIPFTVAGTLVGLIGGPWAWHLMSDAMTDRPTERPLVWSIAAVAAMALLAAWVGAVLVARVRPGASVAGEHPPTAFDTDLLATALLGAFWSGIAVFFVVGGALLLGLHPLAAVGVAVAWIVLLIGAVRTERRFERPLGAWDYLPLLAPQPVIRRVEDLPPPPAPPETPALG